MRFNHDIAEPRGHLPGQKDIVADAERAERIARGEGRGRVLLIRPFDKAIVDVIAGHHRAGMGRSKDQPRRAHTVVDRIPLKEVIARHDAVAPRQQREMTELGGAAVAQLHVVGVGVKRDGGPVRHRQRILRRQELAAVNQHALTAAPDRGDATVFRAADKTVPQVKDQPRGREVDRTAPVVALELDIIEHEFRQRGEAAEIHHVLELAEGEILRPFRVVKRRVERDLLRGDILGPHINLAPHPGPFDQRAHRHIGDIGHIGQLARVRGRVARLRRHHHRVPSAARRGLKLAVADHPTGGIAGLVRHRRLHVERPGHIHLAPPHIERVVIRVVQKRLKGFQKSGLFILEGFDIARQIEIAAQQ